MRHPGNSDVIQAFTALGQITLAAVLLLFTAYSVFLSRRTFAEYRQERLDATLPVLIFQLWPNDSEESDYWQVDIRIANGGSGAALNISLRWEPEAKVELTHSSPPTALAVGESFNVTLRGSVFVGMFHDGRFGEGADRKDESGRTLIRLGTLRASYSDLHGRTVSTVAHVDIFYINLDEDRDSPLAGKRMSRQAAFSAPTLSELRFIPPSKAQNKLVRGRIGRASAVTDPEFTEEMIAAAMTKADKRICVGSDRCYALPHRLEDARASCTSKGRCKVGWIVSRGGRESHNVWLEVSTGLVKRIWQAGD